MKEVTLYEVTEKKVMVHENQDHFAVAINPQDYTLVRRSPEFIHNSFIRELALPIEKYTFFTYDPFKNHHGGGVQVDDRVIYVAYSQEAREAFGIELDRIQSLAQRMAEKDELLSGTHKAMEAEADRYQKIIGSLELQRDEYKKEVMWFYTMPFFVRLLFLFGIYTGKTLDID